MYPVRTLGMLSAAIGVFQAPIDFNNRKLVFGCFLLFLSNAVSASRNIYRPVVIYAGQRAKYSFGYGELFKFLVLLTLTIVLAMLCLHQLGLTPRLDAYLTTWVHGHSL